MALRVLLLWFLALSISDVFAQQPQGQPPDSPPGQVDKLPRQPTQVRSASFAASGDSAAGSIGGIKTPESTKVSAGGAATQSIPIVVSPGTAGVEPRLSFNYNSHGENSLLGVAWSVGGLPIIHRCPRTVAQDGQRGGINYDSNDRFCLDSQRLMVISGTYGADGSEYRTEIDSFLKITAKTVAGVSGPAYFIVKTKGGETMEFGGNATSDQGRIEAQGKNVVRVWALSKLSDVKGNYLTVTYVDDNDTGGTNGEYRPTQIDYTGNTNGALGTNRHVVFEYNAPYNPRTDQIPLYVGGSKILTTALLTNVKTYQGGSTPANSTLVRDYRLTYEVGSATKRSRLKTISECDGNGNCLPANNPTSQPSWQTTWREGQKNFNLPVWSGDLHTNPLLNVVGDLNGDGLSDIVSYKTAGTAKVHLSNGTNFSVQTWTANLNVNGVHYVMDVNGDGKAEIVAWGTSNTAKVHFINAAGNDFDVASWPGTNFHTNHKFNFPGDFDGDGRQDIASRNSTSTVTMHLSTGSSFTVNTWDCATNSNGVNYVGDFNNDGRADILTWYNSTSVRVCLSTGSNFTPEIWTATDLHTADYLNTPADVNGDGLTDIISWKTSGTVKVHLSKGSGPTMDVRTWDSEFNSNGVMPQFRTVGC